MRVRLTIGRVVAALVALGVVVAIGGMLVSATGVVSISARTGHFRITEWFLKFSMRRSVATHSIGIEVPPLDDPALVRRGAGHFEVGCRPCHGAFEGPPPVAQAMTPHPPALAPVAREYDPEDLFYLVREGIKMSGMPAWPAPHRDDEVWAVVAFLWAMPELGPVGYDVLVFGDPVDLGVPEVVAERCARCHGADGLGRGDAFPRIGGQRLAYLEASLAAYADGDRHSGIMAPIAAGLTAQELRVAAEWYALQAPGPALVDPALASLAEQGRALALGLDEDARVPACAACHGPTDHPRNPVYPTLAGQHRWYLEQQLRLFAAGHRGGTAYAGIMQTVAGHTLEPDQMIALAAYYATLAPEAQWAAAP